MSNFNEYYIVIIINIEGKELGSSVCYLTYNSSYIILSQINQIIKLESTRQRSEKERVV